MLHPSGDASEDDVDVGSKTSNGYSRKPGESGRTTAPLHTALHGDDCTLPKIKSRPVSAGISISQRRLRELDDPIQRFLVLLHKIIYITQLPPSPHSSSRRRLVERFKKCLFHQDSSALSLKVTLSKVLQGSSESVELGSASSDWWGQSLSIKAPLCTPQNQDGTDKGSLRGGVSYEQMQSVIEEVLEESRYYKGTGISEYNNGYQGACGPPLLRYDSGVCFSNAGPGKNIMVNVKMTWFDAQDYCRSRDSDLPTLNNLDDIIELDDLVD
ncbi:hypothetical protein NHX12_001868, partial [Muraenolepis orangiensis]